MKNKWVEFVGECDKTIMGSCKNYEYLVAGLYSEVGEVAGKLKKFIRGDFDADTLKVDVALEIGDCLWYVAMLNKYCNKQDYEVEIDLQQCCSTNLTDNRVYTSFETVLRCFGVLQKSLPVFGDTVDPSSIIGIIDALGYVASSFDLDLVECSERVIEKLRGRDEIGTIQGSGDGIER